MSKLKIFSLISILIFTFPVESGKKQNIKHEYVLSTEITNIRVQAHHASIRLLQSKGDRRKLKVQYRDILNVEEEGQTMIISESSFPDEEKAWKSLNKVPEMKVWVPPLPVKIAVFGGRVTVDKFWKTDLSVFMSGEGSIDIKKAEGNLQIFQGAGSVYIESYKGNITVQAENSRVRLQSCKGQTDLSSFKGRVEVSRSSGNLSVRSFKSPLVLKKFTGQVKFQQEKGGVFFKPVIGSVSGYSKEGEVRGVVHPNEVNIETKTGKIHLDLPHSRAWVTAETWEGRIFTPVYFNRIKTGGMDRSQGRLKGSSKNKGNVFLKSHAGSIRVYQSVN